MAKEIKRFDMEKKPQKSKWYLRPLLWIISFFLAGPFGGRTKINKHGFKSFKEPALILSNHASMVDMADMIKGMFPYAPCFVSTVEEFIGKEWLLRNVGCFPKRKFTTDLLLVKRIAEVIRNMKRSVVIYPEARFSFAGVNEEIGQALGKMAKLCKCRVIVLNQKGNFVRSPQWCKHPYRNVKCIADFIQVTTKEETTALPAEEIQDRINKAFEYNDYKWQYDNKIKITSKARTRGLEKVLYKCPECNKEGFMATNGVDIFCKHCNSKWHMDKYGKLNCLTGPTKFNFVYEWYNFEREEAIKEVESGTYSFEANVLLKEFINCKIGLKPIGTVKMIHNNEGYTLKGTLDDGSEFNLNKPCLSTSSMHFEFDRFGGAFLDFATLDNTWFAFMKEKQELIMKFNFTTEALYQKAKRENTKE